MSGNGKFAPRASFSGDAPRGPASRSSLGMVPSFTSRETVDLGHISRKRHRPVESWRSRAARRPTKMEFAELVARGIWVLIVAGGLAYVVLVLSALKDTLENLRV
jgi:hypothetical protein